jgi:hypothetical protein
MVYPRMYRLSETLASSIRRPTLVMLLLFLSPSCAFKQLTMTSASDSFYHSVSEFGLAEYQHDLGVMSQGEPAGFDHILDSRWLFVVPGSVCCLLVADCIISASAELYLVNGLD